MYLNSRIEVIVPTYLAESNHHALKKSHPYEEVWRYPQATGKNGNQEVGAGISEN